MVTIELEGNQVERSLFSRKVVWYCNSWNISIN